MRRNWRFAKKFSGRSLKLGGSLYKLYTYEKRPATPTHRSLSSRFSPLCLLSSLPFFPSFQPWSCVLLPPPMLLVSLYIFIVPRVPWNSRSFLRRSRCSLQVISFYPASLAIHLPFKYIIFSQKPILLNLPTENKIVVWRYQSAQVRLYAAVREQFFWPVY